MINAIAIDDEPPALRVLENFCNRIDFISLQKTFTKTEDAMKYLEKFPVDLIFLDIHMPAISGIDFYKSIKQETMVIFVTAHSQYAVEGFNLNAIDYLLKPFPFERFQQAVKKANDFKSLATQADPLQDQFLFVRADYSLLKIPIADILFIEGLDDYIKIHLDKQKTIVARMTLKSIHEKLNSGSFIRVHRSYIVPLNRIESVRNRIINIEGTEIPIGNSYADTFFSVFGK
ncbi:MAG: response regulator transcription factor [Bacteroidetes bacterium]|nr:response regulator transcription factor [Bacteroidota bacterium]MBK9524950.1 response regulator transcription factor [Bacteroidota bacterium]MBK9543119.1 response regulator transcription factor [Bacteroidota bacterium]MBP6402103.1 response regulator transcription factor [Bacteroidia bacterium]